MREDIFREQFGLVYHEALDKKKEDLKGKFKVVASLGEWDDYKTSEMCRMHH